MLQEAELSAKLIQRTTSEAPQAPRAFPLTLTSMDVCFPDHWLMQLPKNGVLESFGPFGDANLPKT